MQILCLLLRKHIVKHGRCIQIQKSEWGMDAKDADPEHIHCGMPEATVLGVFSEGLD